MIPITPAAVSLFGAPVDATGMIHSLADVSSSPSLMQGIVPPLAPGTTSAGAIGATGPAPFADLMTEALGQVQQLESQSRVAIEGLMSGKGVDVHEAMIAAQKASMGFELVLSVRNKALSAYQQVMGMQF